MLFFWDLSLCRIKDFVSLFDTQINSKNSILFEGGFHCTSWLFHFHDKQKHHFLLHRHEWKCSQEYCDLWAFVCFCPHLDLVNCKREIVSFFSFHFPTFYTICKNAVFYLFAMSSWRSNQCQFHVISCSSHHLPRFIAVS